MRGCLLCLQIKISGRIGCTGGPAFMDELGSWIAYPNPATPAAQKAGDGNLLDFRHMRSEGVGPVGRRAAGGLMLAAACLYLLFVALVLLKVRAADDGHLIYALDDSYIQLSLSEQIAHGHYGIRSEEHTSPGSSILWPFLLAPFAGHAIHVYVPLILNVLFGLAAVLLLSFAVSRWPPHEIGRAH